MRGFRSADLPTAVMRSYEAAVNPELWCDVLHDIAQAMGAEGMMLLSYPSAKRGLIVSEGVGQLVHDFVDGGWTNTRAEMGKCRDQWELHSESTLFPDNDTERVPFYADFLRPLGFSYFVGSLLAVRNGNYSVFSIERRTGQGAFEKDELAAIRMLLPHMRRAAELSLHLQDAHSAGLIEAFEMMSVAAALLDHSGRVIRLNDATGAVLNDGLRLGRDGHLVADIPFANAQLQKAMRGTAGAPGSGAAPTPMVAIPRQRGRPLVAYALPVVRSAADFFTSARTLLIIRDPDAGIMPSSLVLRQMFGLTPSESEVSLALASGLELEQIAAARHASIETVRTQVRSVLAKTGCTRQAQIVALVHRIGLNDTRS